MFLLQLPVCIYTIDVIYGAHIVSEVVFNVQGGRQQLFDWSICGFRLFVPEGALSPTETCSVTVKALIGGRFILPQGTELVSALYAISVSRKFQKEVKIEMQHCLSLETEVQTKHLNFIKAHETEQGRPLSFDVEKGGKFHLHNYYAELWQIEFSIKGIGRGTGEESSPGNSSHTSDDEGSGNEQSNDSMEVANNSNSGLLATVDNGDEMPSVKTISTVNNLVQSDNSSGSSLEHGVSGNQLDDATLSRSFQPQINVSKGTPMIILTVYILFYDNTDNAVYRGHTFYKRVSRNKWIYKFVAVRHLNVDIKVKQLQITISIKLIFYT